MFQPMLINTHDLLNPTSQNFACDIFCYQAVESELVALLESELARFTPPAPEPIADGGVNSKWAFSSAMQKCIRRGATDDAVRFATAYFSIDPVGIWVRLPLVASCIPGLM